MARAPWVRTARLLAKLTRRAVTRADRTRDRSLHAESHGEARDARQARQTALQQLAFERGRAKGAREADRLAKVKASDVSL